MFYYPNTLFYAEFTTQSPTTGAATDADSLPSATATKNGVDDGTFTLTCAKIDTGRYKITGTVPAGYAAGDRVDISVAATVATVIGKAVVNSFQVVSLAAGTSGTNLDAKISDVKTNTDKIPASPAAVGSAMTLTNVYDAAKNAAPTVGQIDTQLSSTHGSDVWGGSGGSGINACTIYVKDQSNNPTPDVDFIVRDSSDTITVASSKTGSNGISGEVALNAGTYKIRLRKSSVNFTNPATIVVTAAAQFTISGTVLSPSVPAAGLQTLWDYVISAITGDAVEIFPLAQQQAIASGYIAKYKIAATIDSRGYWEAQLVQGGRYKVVCNSGGLTIEKTILVSTDSSKRLQTYS